MSTQDKELIELMKVQVELSKEMLKYLKFSGSKEITAVLSSRLDIDQKKQAYMLSDGKNTGGKVGELVGLKQQKVSDLWRQWTLMGLGEAIPTTGGSRFKRSFDLRAFGIQYTEVEQKTSKLESEQGGKPETGENENDNQ